MTTTTVTGFSWNSIVMVGGGAPAVGKSFRFTGDYSTSTHGWTVALTDDDARADGSPYTPLDGNQTAVVKDQNGATVLSGPARLGWHGVADDGAGNTINFYEVIVNGHLVAYISDQPIEPGVTYYLSSYTETTTGPFYSSLASTTWEQSADNLITGGGYADDLKTGAGADTVYGGGGSDTIDAGSGDDLVVGGTGNDTVSLGAGNDSFGTTADLEDGNDLVYGGDGDDYIHGGNGNDTLYGEAGNDTLVGGAGTDYLYGGEGSDIFQIVDDDDITHIYGGTSSWDADTMWFSTYTSSQGVTVTFADNTGGAYAFKGTPASGTFTEIEAVGGTSYADTIDASASSYNVTLWGISGDDLIKGGSGYDMIFGGSGADTILGGAGNDQIWGESGNDSIDAGAGDDTVYLDGNSGSDTIAGGAGQDVLSLSETGTSSGYTVTFSGDGTGTVSTAGTGQSASFTGIEAISGSAISDTIDASATTAGVTVWSGDGGDMLIGGSGADELGGGAGDDLISGGAGDDALHGLAGDDTLIGGTGANTMWGYEGSDTFHISGLATSDTIYGGESAGDDDALVFDADGATTGLTLTFGAWEFGSYTFGSGSGNFWEIEHVTGSSLADSIDASAAWSPLTLEGGAGDDTILGGYGADTILGGDGADRLGGGEGDDILTGGAGGDVFVLSQSAGNDTVTDFDMTLVGGRTSDQLDISGLRTLGGDPVLRSDVVVSDDGSGNAVLTFPAGETLTLAGVTPAQASTQMWAMGIPCVARGTLIRTPGGARPVESLRAGDLVMTRDHGAQPLLWVGSRDVSRAEARATPAQRPVKLRQGAVGNTRDFLVSPQHCLAVELDGCEVLVRARHLAEARVGPIRIARGRLEIEYFHLMTPRHEILFAEGAPSESLWPGRLALLSLGPKACTEIAALIPGLAAVLAGQSRAETVYGPKARAVLTRRQVLAGRDRLTLRLERSGALKTLSA